eukprot:10340611-Alexandrium_andersonii.AAC.1
MLRVKRLQTPSIAVLVSRFGICARTGANMHACLLAHLLACLFAGWLAGCLAGWLVGWLACLLA